MMLVRKVSEGVAAERPCRHRPFRRDAQRSASLRVAAKRAAQAESLCRVEDEMSTFARIVKTTKL